MHIIPSYGMRPELAPIQPAWLSMAHAVIAAATAPQRMRPASGQSSLLTGCLPTLSQCYSIEAILLQPGMTPLHATFSAGVHSQGFASYQSCAGGLASLIPPASGVQHQLQGQLQARASKPLVYWPKAQQAGQARWVAEADLPLWLVRSHEEKSRRDAALAVTEAERLAARVCLL